MNHAVSRIALLTLSAFLVACPASNNSASGPSGPIPTGPSNKPSSEELCVGDSTPCGKWKKQCRKDCFVLPAGDHRDECTDTCNSSLSACEETCQALKDPTKFDPESDWVDMPPKPKAYAPDCGGVDQEACTDTEKYDECQPDLIKVEGASDTSYCFASCKTAADESIDPTTFHDECDETHLCSEVKTNVKTCVPAECDPAKGTHAGACRLPLDRCHGGIASKANYGICDLTCRTEEAGTCPAQQTCYTFVSKSGSDLIPFNICMSKAAGTLKAVGAACTVTVQQDQSSGAFTTTTEDCVAGAICTALAPAGGGAAPATTCYKSCWNAAQGKTDSALCTDASTECKGVGQPQNAYGIPQGGMYICVPKPTREAGELQLQATF